MTGHLRIKSPWVQLVVLMVVFLPQLFVLVLGLFLAEKVKIEIDVSTQQKINELKWGQAVSSLAFFLLPAFLYAVFTFRRKYFWFLGLKKAQVPNMYVLAVLCVILSFPFVYLLGSLNAQIHLPEWMTSLESDTSEQMKVFLKANNITDLIVNLVVIALLPAFCEEIFFRGAMQRVMIHLTKNAWAGIIITAILFSALHMQFMGFLPRMFMGIVLGAFYWYSGSLWTSIIAHFVYNGIQVIMAAYYTELIEKNPETPMLAGIASGIAVWAIIWYYRKQSTATWSKVYRTDELTPTNQFIA